MRTIHHQAILGKNFSQFSFEILQTLGENTNEAIVNEVVRIFTSGTRVIKRNFFSLKKRTQGSYRSLGTSTKCTCWYLLEISVASKTYYLSEDEYLFQFESCIMYISHFMQVSEDGVHRPTVAGIHGRESKGAYSIVSSGEYEEDKDYGDHFLYSGCGGKESDKSKKLAAQVYDQQLRI